MKKTLEYFYIFSKLSTSFILLLSILVLVYFFYVSFKNQDKPNIDQVKFFDKINKNSDHLINLSQKIKLTNSTVSEIKKIISNGSNNNSEEISLLNKQIIELNTKLENISINLETIQSLGKANVAKTQNKNNSSLLIENNKFELVKLVIFKFENNLDFNEELKMLENLNNTKKQHIFEKINMINTNDFRGKIFLKKSFSQELDIFLKKNISSYSSNFITKSIMSFIAVEPSKKNTIKNNEINILNEISFLLDQKKYKTSYQKIINVNNYEKYFNNTLRQLKIFIEFDELIQKVG